MTAKTNSTGTTGPVRSGGAMAAPVYAAAALTLAFIWNPGFVEVSYEHRQMLLVLNSLFVTGISAWVATLAYRGFMASGLSEMLYAGCGLIAMGSSFLLTGLIIGSAEGPDDAITVHNLGVLCGSLFHLAAALHADQPGVPRANPSAAMTVSAYIGVLVLVGVFWIAAAYDFAPPFYIAGKGPTPIRQLVLVASLALLAVAATVLIRNARRRSYASLRYYGLGLALIGLGLLNALIAVPGSVLSWTGRICQYCGHLYILAAFMTAIRAARQKKMGVQESAAEYYLGSEDHYRMLVNVLRAAVISIDPGERVVLWNPKAEAIFGYTHAEVAGKPLSGLVTADGAGRETLRDTLKNRPEHYQDMTLRKKDGTEFPADVMVFATGGGWKQWTNLIIRDTTDRKQAEQALRKSNEQLEQLVRERTAQLEDTVATLKNEVVVRRRIQAQLHQLSRKSLEALEADRRMVSRELHDSIGGSLAAIKFGLEYAVEQIGRDPACSTTSLETIISQLADTIKETKRISVNLRPLTLDDLGLLATIDSYARQFSQRYGHIRLIREIKAEEQDIPDELKIVVYRVMQEAMANAAKHSRADTLHIRLRREDVQVVFEVEDNGCGFSLNNVFSRNDGMSGFGLKSMQERAEICNGVFDIRTRPDGGTRIRVMLPVGGPQPVFTGCGTG